MTVIIIQYHSNDFKLEILTRFNLKVLYLNYRFYNKKEF